MIIVDNDGIVTIDKMTVFDSAKVIDLRLKPDPIPKIPNTVSEIPDDVPVILNYGQVRRLSNKIR